LHVHAIVSLGEFYRDIKAILRGNVLILFITWVLLGFGNNMVHKFDGLYFSALGASDVVLGFMGALTFGMMALLQIPGGHLADTLGRKRVIVTFTFVMAFSILIFAFAPSWEYIVIGLVISNVALLYQPALFSIVMDSLPPAHRAEGFAITNLSGIASLAAPMAGGLLIEHYGLVPGMRIGYFILFILSITAAFMRLSLKETMYVKKEERDSFLSLFQVLKTLNPRAKGMIVVAMLVSSSTGMVGYFVVKYAYTYTSTFMFGVLIGVSMLISTLLGVVVGRYGDRRGKGKFYVAGAFLMGLALVIFIYPSVYYLMAYAVVVGMGMALYQPSSNGLIADLVGIENRGRFTGVYLFLSYISTMFFSILGGFLYRESPEYLFLFAAALAFAGGIMAFKVFYRYDYKNGGE